MSETALLKSITAALKERGLQYATDFKYFSAWPAEDYAETGVLVRLFGKFWLHAQTNVSGYPKMNLVAETALMYGCNGSYQMVYSTLSPYTKEPRYYVVPFFGVKALADHVIKMRAQFKNYMLDGKKIILSDQTTFLLNFAPDFDQWASQHDEI